MKIKTAEFVISNTDITKCPKDAIPEYAFIGRSNVGKSSLINYITNHKKLAKICPDSTPPLPLAGYKFSEFFKWLSNSISIITKSKDGENISLPPGSGWTQMQI